jgi:hypothetical protein
MSTTVAIEGNVSVIADEHGLRCKKGETAQGSAKIAWSDFYNGRHYVKDDKGVKYGSVVYIPQMHMLISWRAY